ncbi:MAG: SDR family oxidoreductase [Bacteroidota bacterium]
MKTILITGSSTGIGKATAIYFAEKGWNVAATMRNTENGKDLSAYPHVKVLVLDVMNQASIDKAIEETIALFGRIDVLFNNAGYALVGAFEAMSEEQIKKQFDTNVFGVMNVTRAILPYFRNKRSGTIINTTSMGGLFTFPLYSVYHATKWALEGFMESLHYELKPFNIRIKNIEPGAIRTDFYDRSLQLVSMPAYDAYVKTAHSNMLNATASASNAEVVAKEVFKAATDNNFRLRYPVGGGSSLLLFIRKLVPLNIFFALMRWQVEKGLKK